MPAPALARPLALALTAALAAGCPAPPEDAQWVTREGDPAPAAATPPAEGAPPAPAEGGAPGPGGNPPSGPPEGVPGAPPPEQTITRPVATFDAAKSSLTLSGTITPAEAQEGVLRLDVMRTTSGALPELLHSEELKAAGPFSLKAPPSLGEIRLVVYWDIKNPGPQDGETTGSVPVRVDTADVANLEIKIEKTDKPDENAPGAKEGAGATPPPGAGPPDAGGTPPTPEAPPAAGGGGGGGSEG